jgi:hypothetical protein
MLPYLFFLIQFSASDKYYFVLVPLSCLCAGGAHILVNFVWYYVTTYS